MRPANAWSWRRCHSAESLLHQFRRILASPEEALKRSIKKSDGRDKNDESDDDDGEEENYKMTDLFDILTANSPKAKTTGKSEPTTRMFPSSIIECTMLSLLLIFKDICPGYKIRPRNMSMQDVRLKKETKRHATTSSFSELPHC